MTQLIKIALADDHELFRKALISLFKGYPNISIIHEAKNGKELIKNLINEKVDIALLDVEMPEMNGIETLKTLKEKFSGIKVIILSMHNEESFIADLIIKGANGFVTKGCSIVTLLETITGVYNNQYYFKQNISAEVVKALEKRDNLTKTISNLTSREVEILNLICKGNSHKQIADKLFITARTVDFHKSNLYKKTSTRCAANLYEYALTNGLITAPVQKN